MFYSKICPICNIPAKLDLRFGPPPPKESYLNHYGRFSCIRKNHFYTCGNMDVYHNVNNNTGSSSHLFINSKDKIIMFYLNYGEPNNILLFKKPKNKYFTNDMDYMLDLTTKEPIKRFRVKSDLCIKFLMKHYSKIKDSSGDELEKLIYKSMLLL